MKQVNNDRMQESGLPGWSQWEYGLIKRVEPVGVAWPTRVGPVGVWPNRVKPVGVWPTRVEPVEV